MSSTNEFCISILPRNEDELRVLLPKCQDCDLIEIRFDYLREPNLKLVSQHRTKPVIITIRTKEEGGFYTGSSTELIRIYQQVIDSGTDYIDISQEAAEKILPRLKLNNRTRLILSCHSRESNLTNLKRKLDEMTRVKPDVYKLVFQAESLNDNIAALHLIDYAKTLNIPFVIHAQGEEGKLSRIIGSFRGNLWTYVSLTDQKETAPGQLSIEEATDQYYLHEKNTDTRIIGLVGYPIAQSRGWKLYNKIFHLLDQSDSKLLLNIIYLNFPVTDVTEFWEKWQDQIDGLSVTIPHKGDILQYANRKSKEVESSGVCNTLLRKHDSWEAYNVDLLAMTELLKPYKRQLNEGAVLIFGTGATTRSAIAALQNLGIQRIYLTGRNKEKGRLLAESFSITFLVGDANPPDLSAIIQTTPVGMYPNVEAIPPCAKHLKKGMIVFDVVPNPTVTRFLQTAKEMGCITIFGEEMYLHQAVKQFELFTGVSISVDYVKNIWNEMFV